MYIVFVFPEKRGFSPCPTRLFNVHVQIGQPPTVLCGFAGGAPGCPLSDNFIIHAAAVFFKLKSSTGQSFAANKKHREAFASRQVGTGLCAFCSSSGASSLVTPSLFLKAEGTSGEFADFIADVFTGERRRKRRPGAISAPYGAPTEPRASRPSVRPLARLLRAFALRRGNVAPHTRRAVPTSRGGTPRPASLPPRLCSRVPSTLCD